MGPDLQRAFQRLVHRNPRPVRLNGPVWMWGYWHPHDGYGHATNLTAKAILDSGRELGIFGLHDEHAHSPRRIESAALRKRIGAKLNYEVMFSYCMGPDLQHNPMSGGFVLLSTMWEADRMRRDWMPFLSGVDGIVVPSVFCMDAVRLSCQDYDLSCPEIRVVGLPVNREYCKLQPRKVRTGGPFRFLFVSTPCDRKGIDILVSAFKSAFEGRGPEKVRLHLHTRWDGLVPNPIADKVKAWAEADPRVTVTTNSLNVREMIKLYGRHDCLVHVARGEGFGMTPIQAMATGMPTICVDAHGCKEFVRLGNAWPVEILGWEDTKHPFYPGGRWTIPSAEHAAFQMQQVYDMREDAIEAARIGAPMIWKEFREAAIGRKFVVALEDLIRCHNRRLKDARVAKAGS